jgi:hypothetical protein
VRPQHPTVTLLVKILLIAWKSTNLLLSFYTSHLVVILENGLSSCSSSVSCPCRLPGLSNSEANSQATVPFAADAGCAYRLVFNLVFSILPQGDKIFSTSCPISFFP